MKFLWILKLPAVVFAVSLSHQAIGAEGVEIINGSSFTDFRFSLKSFETKVGHAEGEEWHMPADIGFRAGCDLNIPIMPIGDAPSTYQITVKYKGFWSGYVPTIRDVNELGGFKVRSIQSPNAEYSSEESTIKSDVIEVRNFGPIKELGSDERGPFFLAASKDRAEFSTPRRKLEPGTRYLSVSLCERYPDVAIQIYKIEVHVEEER